MKVTSNIEITMSLSLEEAEWLKSVVQNPINSDIHSESTENKKIREDFFLTLHHCIENHKGN